MAEVVEVVIEDDSDEYAEWQREHYPKTAKSWAKNYTWACHRTSKTQLYIRVHCDKWMASVVKVRINERNVDDLNVFSIKPILPQDMTVEYHTHERRVLQNWDLFSQVNTWKKVDEIESVLDSGDKS